ncbi:hypothetical protein VE04_08168, partial [Pseudogymnoascus sp. 24MN13]
MRRRSGALPQLLTQKLSPRRPLSGCVNSFSSFSNGGDDARWFRANPARASLVRRPENDPLGVGGATEPLESEDPTSSSSSTR